MAVRRRPRREDYTVGWVCALSIELAAAQEMLDEEHKGFDHVANDTNIYTLGQIGDHNVVIACLPEGQTGTNSAAAVAVQMKSTFTSIRFGLMVGIGGGVPSVEVDIRLGDVVISRPNNVHGGVVQYSFGKATPSGFERTGFLNAPPTILLNAVAKLRANHIGGRSRLQEYLSKFNGLPTFTRENTGPDILFNADYNHVGGAACEQCSKERVWERPSRNNKIVIHRGTIASGNEVMRDGPTRDRVSSELGGVLCFEMEAAGLMNSFPCLVIRGICDYADSHKNKIWQGYAAGTAAACAKEVLLVIPVAEVAESYTADEIIREKHRYETLLTGLPNAVEAPFNSYQRQNQPTVLVPQSPGSYPSTTPPQGQSMYPYPTANSQPPIIAQQVMIPVTQHTQQFPIQSADQSLLTHHQPQTTPNSNLIWTAQRIVASWNNHDFPAAEKHLEEQLAAVERGETITIHNQAGQPLARLLCHLIGVCASFNGNFLKAKKFFQSVQRDPYFNGANLDDGDIAAARWLGDTCLHLNEPQNAGLAWAVALEGLIVRYGIGRAATKRILEECRLLEQHLGGLTSLSKSFSRFNTDASNIFGSTPHMEKARLVGWALDRLKQVPSTFPSQPPIYLAAPNSSLRPRIEWKVTEGFLVQPLISQSAWPLQYDPFFSPQDTITLIARIASNNLTVDGTNEQHFTYDRVPAVGLGQSKQLDFATKRDVRWLVPTLMAGLVESGIEFKEKGSTILCRLSQIRDNIAYFEGVGIKVKKLQFRSVWGVKVTESLYQTRVRTTPSFMGVDRNTKGFVELVKGILERAEADG